MSAGLRQWNQTARRWWVPLLLATAIVFRCAIESHQRLMWTDEFLTWYPIRAPFRLMWEAARADINAAPPLYFVVLWAWARVAGASATSLRLFSGLNLASAVLILTPVLRRRCGRAGTIGLALATLNPDLLGQLAQARFHLMMVCEVAAILAVVDHVEKQGPTRRRWLLHAGLHAALVMTSYIGAFYAVALVAAEVAGFRARSRWCLVTSALSGWIVFVPWIPVLVRHIQIGKPSFWIPVPTASALAHTYLNYFGGWLPSLGLAAFVLAALIRRRRQASPASSGRGGFWLATAAVGLVPCAAYLYSHQPGATSIFLPRYLIAGWAPAAALGSAAIAGAFLVGGTVRITAWAEAGWVVGVSVILVATRLAVLPDNPPIDGPTFGGPIVIEHVHPFLKRHRYAADPSRYYFLLDPAIAAREGGGWPGTHRFLGELKRIFPGQFPTVVNVEPFLSSTPAFWVLRGDAQWYEMRIAPDPRFIVDRQTTNEAGLFVHLSRRSN